MSVTDLPGYLSVADLPGTAIELVGTGTFQDILFDDQALRDLAEGPCFIQAQLYFYKVAGATTPKGWILQTQRSSNDPTADDACYWPADWPFSYVPKLYGPTIDFVKTGNLGRGIRIAIPAGTKLGMKAHILKVARPLLVDGGTT